MHASRKRRRAAGAVALVLVLALGAGPAQAAGPPVIAATWSSAIQSNTARLSARVEPNGVFTTYHFEYLTEAAYGAGGGSFAGALHSPPSGESSLGSNPLTVTRALSGLSPSTTYRYRVLTTPASSPPDTAHTFTTKGPAPLLPDNRGWEMVSPVDKNGGQVDPPGTLAGGGTLQAAASGGSVTYGSTASFAGGLGGPAASQYLAARGSDGWATENVTAPISYASADQGVPYQLFSGDLARGLLFNGNHCAVGAGHCTVENLPLAGTDAPPGYQDYYLREGSSGAFTALLSNADIANLDLGPDHFDLRFAGASPDLTHVVLSSCAALTPGAGEVAQGADCDPTRQNLYEWSAGAGLSLVNGPTPDAALAAQSAAVSADGERVYWNDTATGDLYLRDGTGNHLVDSSASFQIASADGATALYTKAGGLYSYDAVTHIHGAALASGVLGVLGASEDATTVYFQDSSGLKRRQGGVTTQIAAGAEASDPGDYPPATGTARVSADGTKLLFLSRASLTGYDNTDLITGDLDTEVFLYDASAATPLACVSCNPTNGRPIGPSTIPGAVANGTAPGSTRTYRPRVLSSDGKRVFFDSADSMTLTDTNQVHSSGAGIADVYQWEAQGEGDCAKAGGCLALISSGRSAGGAVFVDASADGTDAFFITDDSLVSTDPGSFDLYDARIGGGFPVLPPPIACEGDACQVLPSPPADPTLTTLLSGFGNPPVHYDNFNQRAKPKRCRGRTAKRKGRCARKRHLEPDKHRGRR